MRTVFLCALLILESLLSLYAQQGGETVTVEVQGLGKDAQSAEKNALYQAVERAVGTYVDNEIIVKNEDVIRDKVLTVAQGFVQNFEVLSPPKERRDGSGLWEIKIKAVVKKSEVGAALRSAGVMAATADGKAAWATQITRLKSREDAMALLEKVIPEIPRNLVLCSLEQAGDKLQIEEDPKTGNQQIVVKVRMEINYDWWMKEAVPALDAAFTQLRLVESTPEEFQLRWKFSNFTESDPQFAPKLDNTYGYKKPLPITSLKWTSRSILDVDKSYRPPESHWPAIPLLLLVETGSSFKFKAYVLPEDWEKKIHKLWSSDDDDAPDRFEAVRIQLEGDAPIVLLEIPLNVHSRLLDRLFPGDSAEQFAPSFSEWAGSGWCTQMTSITYTAKIDASPSVLKETKRIILKAARFGIKQPVGSASGTSHK